jgi:hypothetical protein
MDEYLQCPSKGQLLKYLFNELEQHEDIKILEKHFFYCDECTKTMREYNKAYCILLSLKREKSLYDREEWDVAMMPAAGSEKNLGASEAISINGKYNIKLIPFLNKDKSVLIVEIIGCKIEGILTVGNDSGVLLRSKVVNGRVCEEIPNPVDLKNIITK